MMAPWLQRSLPDFYDEFSNDRILIENDCGDGLGDFIDVICLECPGGDLEGAVLFTG